MRLFHISSVHIACTLLLTLSKSKRTSAWGVVKKAINTAGGIITDAADAVANEVVASYNTAANVASSATKEVAEGLSIMGESYQYFVGEVSKSTNNYLASGVNNIVHVANQGLRFVDRAADFTSEVVDKAIQEIADLVQCLGDVAESYIEDEYGCTADFDLIQLKIALECDLSRGELGRNLRQGKQDKPQQITTSNGIQLTVYPNPVFELNDNIEENDIVSEGKKNENSSINDDHILGSINNIAEFSSGCNENQYCAGGVAAKVGSVISIKPIVGIAFDGLQKTMEVTGDFTTTVSNGISIMAGGSCGYEKLFYFPKAPKILATACYYGVCVSLLSQGKVKMSIQGTFLAGARAVNGIEFNIKGNAVIDLDNPDELNANFNVENPQSGWKLEAHGEMMTGITLESGVIISVMVTPGVVVSTYPYVKLETTLFGSMSYEYGEGSVPDATLSEFSFPNVACGSSPPKSKTSYTRNQKGEVKTRTTTSVSGEDFYVENDFENTETCVALGQSLRAGVEISAGGFPIDMQDALENVSDLISSMSSQFCKEFIAGMFPASEAFNGISNCLEESFHVPLPETDDLAKNLDPVCDEVLKVLVEVATSVNPGGLNIPLQFPNGKQCFDIFKVGAGPDSCMSAVGCDDLPQGTSLEYPSADMLEDNWSSVATSYQNYFNKIAKVSGKEAFLCGVSSKHDNGKEDRRFKFKFCRPADDNTVQKNKISLDKTEYDGKWVRECSGNRFISEIKSYYDGSKKDRIFYFKCAEFDGWRKGALCGWSNEGNYVNGWDEPFAAECGESGAIAAVASEHHNHYEDRKFSFKCCQFKKIGVTNKSQYTNFVNSWDNSFERQAKVGNIPGAMCAMSSYHDNGKEDRRYKLRYAIPTGHSGSTTPTYLSWTNWDAFFEKNCSGNEFITYVRSYHSNHYEDRRFLFGCGSFTDVTKKDCKWSNGWYNEFDAGFTFECAEDRALGGISSYHSNNREDRRFRFNCCLMDKNAP